MAADQDIAAFRRLIDEGFSGGNLDLVDEIVAPDCVTHQRGLKPGAAGVKEAISTLHRWFDDFTLTTEDVVWKDGTVWARSRSSGTHTGRMMGHEPTGRRIGIYVFDVCRFENGKIVEHWGVPDQLGVLEQLGFLPGPRVGAPLASGVEASGAAREETAAIA